MKRTAVLSPHDIPAAFGLLTRLPIPMDSEKCIERGAKAAWAFPVVGAVVGVIAGAVHTAATVAGLPQVLSVGLALCVLIMVTGALHEDGLADCADGFFGGWTPERRLEIMKDSRIGVFGVLALIMVTGLRFGALTSLSALHLTWIFVATGMMSRAAMGVLWAALPAVRKGGLSAADRPGLLTATIGALMAIGASLILLPLGAVVAAALSTAVTVAVVGCVARRKIGGQTGDVLGASQQCAEVASLLTFVSVLI